MSETVVDFNHVNAMLGESARSVQSLSHLLQNSIGDDFLVTRLRGRIRQELRQLEYLIDVLPEAYERHGQPAALVGVDR